MLPKQLDHHVPRFVLGFHTEIPETRVSWLILVWELEAVSCQVSWPEEFSFPDLKMEQEHSAGYLWALVKGRLSAPHIHSISSMRMF